MLELGEFSEELHEKVGKEVAKNKIDILITIGLESENIALGAEKVVWIKQQYTNLDVKKMLWKK